MVSRVEEKGGRTRERERERERERGREEEEERCCLISAHARNRSEMTDGSIMETLCSCEKTTAQ